VCNIVVLFAGVGALNWGLVALWRLDLVTAVFGETIVARVVSALMGMAGLGLLASCIKPCPCRCTLST
jgi:uncharacterized membrane protein YuzA (DUF378 family)